MVKFEVYLKTRNPLQLSLKLKLKAQHPQLQYTLYSHKLGKGLAQSNKA